jgi:hypothetical protein
MAPEAAAAVCAPAGHHVVKAASAVVIQGRLSWRARPDRSGSTGAVAIDSTVTTGIVSWFAAPTEFQRRHGDCARRYAECRQALASSVTFPLGRWQKVLPARRRP